MTTAALIAQFHHKHQALTDYINALSDEDFMHRQGAKWTPGQQLRHVHLCLKPIAHALTSKDFIRGKFGVTDHPAMSYSEVIGQYTTALQQGGKAPEKFVPEPVALSERATLKLDLQQLIHHIQQLLDTYTDQELDMLVLPHPLPGLLTIRELFYLMTYHATHHLLQTQKNLNDRHPA